MRARYRLVGGGDTLIWERPIPNDSRVERITCSATWFYAQMTAHISEVAA